MGTIQQVLEGQRFETTHHVEGRASIADLFKLGQRCGIYVLQFADGMVYCGQSKDVVRRYAQHRKIHTDIVHLSFKRVRPEQLDSEEGRGIKALEAAGFSLRNISLVSIVHGSTDFDDVMSPDLQEQWAKDVQWVDRDGDRVRDPDLRSRYSRKFHKFLALPYAEDVIRVQRAYVQKTIPAFLRGEVSFWATSVLPPGQPGELVYSRINIHWQEVFTAFVLVDQPRIIGLFDKIRGCNTEDISFSFHLCRSKIEEVCGTTRGLRGRYRFLEVSDHRYKPGGQDQFKLTSYGAGNTLRLLNDPSILAAMRVFNLRLMRKGACNFGRNHCLDLADRLVDVS